MSGNGHKGGGSPKLSTAPEIETIGAHCAGSVIYHSLGLIKRQSCLSTALEGL